MGQTDFDTLGLSGTAITSTAAELNKLDGVSVSATEMDYRALTTQLTLGSAGTVYVVSPFDGNVIEVWTAIDQALTTGDETLTIKDKDGNTMGSITLTQSGSAAGDVDFDTSLTNNDVASADPIEIETDGANGTAAICTITLLIDIT